MNIMRTIAYYLIIPLFIVGLMFGCKTVEESRDTTTVSRTTDSTVVADIEETTELQKLLNENRSKLSDVYISQNHDMPEGFLKEDASDESINSNPYDGYRVQILSTRKVEVADSVAGSFRIWADTTITGYNANAYVSFRQPYFKVHIGDFQQRDHANRFSKLIKKKYPDAWVVHDRINPSDVPADTATFTFKKDEAAEDSLSSNN